MATFKGTIRGTTPTFVFNLPFDVSTLANCEIYFAQDDTLFVTKSLSDCVASGNQITVTLTQSDTLAFDDEEKLQIQVRFIYTDGTVEATNVTKKKVGQILKEGEISGEHSN